MTDDRQVTTSGDVLHSHDSEYPSYMNPPRPDRSATRFWQGVAVVVAGVAAMMIAYLLISGTPTIGIWESHILISICTVVLIVSIVIRQENKWVWPIRRMNRMLPRI